MSLWSALGDVVSDGLSVADRAAADVVSAGEAIVEGHFEDALSDIEDATFDAARAAFGTAISEVTIALHAIGQPVESLGMGILAAMDPANQVKSNLNAVMTGNWRTILTKLAADVKYVPVLGEAAANIIASGLALYDDLTTPGGVAKAIKLAYDYAMANIPGADLYEPELDPIVDALIRIAFSKRPVTDAVCDAIVTSITEPIPRAIAAALVAILVHGANIEQVGLDLTTQYVLPALYQNLSVIDQATSAVGDLVAQGKSAGDALMGALDHVAADAGSREAWDDLRSNLANIADNETPLIEEVQGFANNLGVAGDLASAAIAAGEKALGQMATNRLQRLQNLLQASRPWTHAVAVEGMISGLQSDAIQNAVAMLPIGSRATPTQLANAPGPATLATAGVSDLLTAAENARPLLAGSLNGVPIPTGQPPMQALATILAGAT